MRSRTVSDGRASVPSPSQMARIDAIIFDLYGTLLEVDAYSIHREIPRLIGVRPRAWLELVRETLLTTSFPDSAAFSKFICERLAPGHDAELEERVIDLVEAELESVYPQDGVLSLLSFLKRRGYKLGLLSNLSSTYKQPVFDFKLAEHFDALAFSCDEGIKKPDPEIYLRLCSKLGVDPSNVLVVGDSLKTDIEAPARLGMMTLKIGRETAGVEAIDKVADLGWFLLEKPGSFETLLREGLSVPFPRGAHSVEKATPVADTLQGRYNLVYRVATHNGNNRPGEIFCKRFLLPESSYVEEFAYRLHRAIGLPSCDALVVKGSEPFLAITTAPGRKYLGELDPGIAHELGSHHVFAYLFSNADMRPRNTFLDYSREEPRITLVDLEHCFFNLAIDTTGLSHPCRPQSIDGLNPDEIRKRTAHRVLSERAMRRARRTFINTEEGDPWSVQAFRRGFLQLFTRLQNDSDRILGLLEERIYTEPYLVIGTQAYRRAMARVDLDDIRGRLLGDPVKALDSFA